nr:MAG TPA: hypothetical protein [Caudoviricetes sp.]
MKVCSNLQQFALTCIGDCDIVVSWIGSIQVYSHFPFIKLTKPPAV